ncbi:MAG TPA: UDP-glucose 4-epimerase GalE [Myxococcota bacterium]|nr:UDP-glucose 4-epimerase GalE [Myxococcota bacterium]
MRLLVTGGAGYIGAHILVELLAAGHQPVVLDNFSYGYAEAVRRAGRLGGAEIQVIRGDIADLPVVRTALEGVEAVIHLAAYKMVDESMERPDRYFHNNAGGMAALLHAMEECGIRKFLYSSTSAVYGTQTRMPISEDAPLRPDSPYGLSKAQGETMLDWMAGRRGWSAVSLRYFNPVGAHASGTIGQPFEAAASLVPRALKALTRPQALLTIFGTDYATPDGTCLRDYIHITDLARAHLVALQALEQPGHRIYNVGTGRPYSVREVLAACGRVTGRPVPTVEGDRRPGDIPCAVAAPERFSRDFGFEAKLGLEEMVASAWKWWLQNPEGYDGHGRAA